MWTDMMTEKIVRTNLIESYDQLMEFGQNSHNGLSDESNQYNLDRTPSFAKVNGKVVKKSDEKNTGEVRFHLKIYAA
jgi:hypothetical protein